MTPGNQPSSNPQGPSIKLDGQPIAIASALKPNSLSEIVTQLERLAIQQDRVLCSLSINGIPVPLPAESLPHQPIRLVEANSIPIRAFAQQIIHAVREKIFVLEEQVHAILLLVLINEIGFARRAWGHLLPSFKAPLYQLSLLEELKNRAIEPLQQLSRNLKEHWNLIDGIHAQLDLVLHGEDAEQARLEFSDVLDRRLLPWLAELNRHLSQCNAAQDSFLS